MTGGGGLLGWWLVRAFRDRGFAVHATYHSRKPRGPEGVTWHKLELSVPDSVSGVFKEARPELVIHAAAFTDVDGCESDKERAFSVNYLGTRAVAEKAHEVGAFLVYVSTDYVFDGEKGLYDEKDVPSPVNYYGISKLLGEVAVQSLLPDSSLIVRVSGLYGYSPTGKKNFGYIMLKALLEGRVVRAFYDQYLSPTYVPWLAYSITEIIEKDYKTAGIIHMAGPRLSRYQFALSAAMAVGRKRELVEPVPLSSVGFAARRPKDSSLSVERAKELGMVHPPVKDTIIEMADILELSEKR